jgi:MFS family permease
MPTNDRSSAQARWYHGVTGYQWLVLAIASAGWIFDVYEGQIFNITRNQMLADILKVAGDDPDIKGYGDYFLAIFLAGGAFGGLLFGSLADRWGRRPTMVLTILVYSIFSGLTYFAQTLWQVAALRFFVAVGVGGEWAVAASLVAEVFPQKARAHASGIFHATSILGTWAAALAGLAVGAHWRYAYLIGVVPALLVVWVMASVKEPESWAAARAKAVAGQAVQLGSFRELLFSPRWGRRALLGMLLAAVGLGSFWGVSVAGQDLVREMLVRNGMAAGAAAEEAKFAYGVVQTAGAGLGLLAFGPLCVKLGRRRAFMWSHLGACLIVPITCYAPQTYGQLLVLLPVFGFLTLTMHAGYAIYFPELFPTHLRATGAGFCFNAGRVVAASLLWLSGWVKSLPGMDLRMAVMLLGLLFLLGLVIIYFLPETKDQPLPE